MTALVGRISPADRAALEAFLSRPGQPGGTMTLIEVQGFLFALAAAPVFRRPSDWLALVFGGEPPDFDSEAEAERILMALMSLYNEVIADVRERDGALPASVGFRDEVLENLDSNSPVSQWSRGFVQGHLWLEEEWRDFGEEALEGLSMSLWALGVWADRSVAEATAAEMEWAGGSVETVLETAHEFFADCAAIYAGTGLALQDYMRELEDPPRPAVRVPRPGRNEPCPCESGRKYKKCCGRLRLV
ncbi:UPF0149 family protein [Candidatus Palauibacter sp.]|uniref:UPF0149 family protein n=1 Tax=Candidatus Palauibacter sp. TaxID=3101350 RepID=UPI003B5CAB5F